jgi:ribosomal-protein-alanine N-acetyltransferase
MNQVEKYFLKSNRLGFRQWSEEDLAIAIELWGDYEVTRFFDARGKWSRDEVQARLVKEIRIEKEYDVQYWPVFLLETDGHVGCCGLRPYDLPQRIYEIGFHIRSNQWRHGYAREAAGAVIDYAFSTLMVNSLFAGHNPNNTASRHLLRQLGFRYTHDEFYSPTGLDHPSYEMNASEYASSKSGSGSNFFNAEC